MAQTASSSSSHAGGWRGKMEISSATSRLLRRVLWSVLGLAMVGLLIYLVLMWIARPPQTYAVALSVVEHDLLAVPPIPFAGEDIRQLQELTLAGPVPVCKDSFEKIDHELKEIDSRPKDTLIWYVSAHGVSDDHTAYLLSSEFSSENETRRCELSELLQQISARPAAVKLLILDAGHIASDPRLGMVVNEFPDLLKKQLEDSSQDPNLWVLTANRPLQISCASFSAGRSIFGYYVVEGLRGAADRESSDPDDQVDLAELFNYVSRGVRGRVEHETDCPDAQTPWLLQSGKGQVTQLDEAANCILVRLSGEEETEAGTPQDEEQETAAPSENNQVRKKKSDAADCAEKIRRFVKQAWQLPDQMRRRPEDPGPGRPWLPVDYAPHRWRELLESLVRYELRYRSGAGFTKDDEFEKMTQRIASVQQGGFPNPKSDQDMGLDESTQGAREIRSLIQLKNDLVFYAPYYVRWYVRASQASGNPRKDLHKPISDLLTELPGFVEELQEIGLSPETRGDVTGALDRLKKSAEPLKELQGDLQRAVDAEVDKLTGSRRASTNAALIESLLSVPLLDTDRRIKLIAALEAIDPLSPETDPSDDGLEELEAQARACAERQWKVLAEQAVLEKQLVLLADPKREQAISSPGPTLIGDQRWGAYRKFGEQLRQVYRDLPGQVNGLAIGDDAARLGAERMLRLVDARDRVIDSNRARSAVRDNLQALTSIQRPYIGVDIDPSEFHRDAQKWVASLEITVDTGGISTNHAELTLTYNPDYLQIERNAHEVKSDQAEAVTLDSPGTVLAYRVVALVDDRKVKTSEVEAVVHIGDKTPDGYDNATFNLPSPDKVDLDVYRIDAAGDTPMKKVDGRIQLRPFPGRVTAFRFKLHNLSDQQRNVSVQLLAAPDLRPGQTPSRDSLPKANVLAADPDVDLGPKAESVGIELKAAKPDEEPGPVVRGPVVRGNDEKSPPKPLTAWACAIQDNRDPASKWVYPIDFVPVPPKRYLQALPDSAYDPVAEEIKIRLSIRRSDGPAGKPNLDVPLLSEEDPVRIVWNTDEIVGLETLKRKDAITPSKDVAELLAGVDLQQIDGKVATVLLDVDGYPRALAYDVRCERRNDQISVAGRTDVRITSPTSGKAYREKQAIPLGFRVDAPSNLLNTKGNEIRVQLIDVSGSLEPTTIRRFRGDRQVEIFLVDATEAGIVQVRADVDDFKTEIKDHWMDNREIRIRVALESKDGRVLQSGQRLEDSVEVFLDSKPPGAVDGTWRRHAEAHHGEPLEFDLRWNDQLSGVKKLEIGVHKDETGTLKDATKVTPPPRPGADGIWHIVVPTKDLAPPEATPETYWLLLRATDGAGNVSTTRKQHFTLLTQRKPPPQPKLGSIRGRIASKDGKPRRNITVTLDPLGRTAETDADGRFRFDKVPPGEYTLKARGSIRGNSAAVDRKVVVTQTKEPTIADVEMSMMSRVKD